MDFWVLEGYLETIRNHVSGWENVLVSEVDFLLLTGTSNKVFKVECRLDLIPKVLIFRVFGPNDVTDKSRERMIFERLSETGIVHKSYYADTKVRIEEFLQDYSPLVYTDLLDQSVIVKICEKLREIHRIDLKDIIPENNTLNENLVKWRKIGMSKIGQIQDLNKKNQIIDLLSDRTWETYLKIVPLSEDPTFTHLDTNFFNILLNKNTGDVRFVDFEFSGYAHKSLDFAFLFSDMRFDYLFPSPPYFSYDSSKAPTAELISNYISSYGESPDFCEAVSRSFIVSNYIWAVWGVAMYSPPCLHFDYLENSLIRYQEFQIESSHFN